MIETEYQETDKHVLDLSKKQLKKVPRQDDAQNVRTLLLDENELQKIDNIDSYLKIEKLSLSKNNLLRMYGVSRLQCLRELNVSFNSILSIEGLKDCIHLRHLNLEGNQIKTIEHLNTNTQLEYLNLGENEIGNISDVSFLKNLKELYLHGNRLTHLRLCDKYLPTSLEVLSLARNNISDLNEICTLTNLKQLRGLAIADNPCVTMTVGPNCLDGFDHRPFVINWCMSVKIIDGYLVDPLESLKAEWLYSQGRGRQFRVGDQAALAKYLSTVCPLVGKSLESENDRKLRLILSKAQHHQRQLQEEIMDNSNTSQGSSPSSHRKKPASRIQSPRFSRLGARQGSPESMVSSYHGNVSNEHANNANHTLQMTTSLIENIKNDMIGDCFSLNLSSGMSSSVTTKTFNSQESTPRNITPNPYNEQQQQIYGNQPSGGPLAAASKMVPVPETLMSPDVCPTAVAQRAAVSALNTQIQNSKTHKNKDNKLNSPHVRSPHLRRTNSPTTSPRRNSSHNLIQQQQAQPNQGQQQKQQQRQQHINSSSPAPGTQNEQHCATTVEQTAATMQPATGFVSQTMHIAANHGVTAGFSSDEDGEQFNADKLKSIRNKVAQQQQQKQQQNNEKSSKATTKDDVVPNTESSAVVIQKIWRGYHTRKKNKDIAEKLQKQRTHEYIDKLSKDMEMTKAQLENERKIQQLQMQAINALWKKVSSMQGTKGLDPKEDNEAVAAENAASEHQPANGKKLMLDVDSSAVVQDLTKSCTMLTSQVQQLQSSMCNIVNCLSLVCNLPPETVKRLASHTDADENARNIQSTQTEIIAVHTPQMEDQNNFPFAKMRPSTLPLLHSTHAGDKDEATTKEQVQPKKSDVNDGAKQIELSEEPNEQNECSDEVKSVTSIE